ncbi:MAG: hypothetical protein LBQ66_12310 [Planctomycetaceae bacterium]|nr:hypothetical protein [Planctomycetaceae bacterium]
MIYWRRYSPRKPGGRLATLRLPNRFGVQFKLVRFYDAQRRAGRPRSSPSPLRGNCRLRRRERFGFIDAFWRSSCRLAPMLFTKKARQSVGYLTFAL